MQPVIGHVIAEVPKESLKNNSHLFFFLHFYICMVFISISSSDIIIIVIIIMSILFCGGVFTMCTTSVSCWLGDKKGIRLKEAETISSSALLISVKPLILA